MAILGAFGEVSADKWDMLKNFRAIFSEAGDVAHFFWRPVWTNETGAIMKSDAGLAIEFIVKTPEN